MDRHIAGQMDGWTDRYTHIQFPSVFYKTSSPSSPLPKKARRNESEGNELQGNSRRDRRSLPLRGKAICWPVVEYQNIKVGRDPAHSEMGMSTCDIDEIRDVVRVSGLFGLVFLTCVSFFCAYAQIMHISIDVNSMVSCIALQMS